MRVIVTGEIPVPILAVILTTSFGGSVSLLELCWSQCISFPCWVSACKAILLQCEVSSSLCNWVLELIFNLFSKWIFQNYFWMSFKCPWKVWDVFIHIFPLFSLWVMTWDAYLIPNDNFLDKKSLSHYIWGCSSADFPILTIITQAIKYLSTPHL